MLGVGEVSEAKMLVGDSEMRLKNGTEGFWVCSSVGWGDTGEDGASR